MTSPLPKPVYDDQNSSFCALSCSGQSGVATREAQENKVCHTRRNGSPREVLVKRQKARARGEAETTYSLPWSFPGKGKAGQLGQLGIGEFE